MKHACPGCGVHFKHHELVAHRRVTKCGINYPLVSTLIHQSLREDKEQRIFLRRQPIVDKLRYPFPRKTKRRSAAEQNARKRIVWLNEYGNEIKPRKARIPGTVRKSRMLGGSGFRNNWES